MISRWISPTTGQNLHAISAHVLESSGERWPVYDGIPFLRADRRALADAALGAIDAGDISRAGALLLTDQDPFAPDPPPDIDDTLSLIADEPRLSFRDAMQRLRLGSVADYFAHRWSDPTFLSGLVLSTAFTDGPILELACGAGHYLPEFHRMELDAIGADLVFAKLWLCRHFISPKATLVCFDAQASWPIPDTALGGVFCHDAFYFIPDKQRTMHEIRRCCKPEGIVAIGHAHNAAAANHSSGLPLTNTAYAQLLGDCTLFDDATLTASFVSRDMPASATPEALHAADAISFLSPSTAKLRPARLDSGSSPPYRLNPLYRRGEDGVAQIAWPSDRYEAEYAPLATYPAIWAGADTSGASHDAASIKALRQRVFLDLPARW